MFQLVTPSLDTTAVRPSHADDEAIASQSTPDFFHRFLGGSKKRSPWRWLIVETIDVKSKEHPPKKKRCFAFFVVLERFEVVSSTFCNGSNMIKHIAS